MPIVAVAAAQTVLEAFGKRFGTGAKPEVYRAPGRVNLIGEHTDYNQGFVFPIAIELSCYVAIAPSGDDQLRILTTDFEDEFVIGVEQIAEAKANGEWRDYPLGVAQQLVKAGVQLAGANLCIASAVPVGSGLSSSAAIEVSTALALLGGREIDKLELVRLAQRAESQFVGVPTGIMDQYASVFGKEHAAIQIDCRDLTHEYAPLPQDVEIIAVNSLVKHEHGTGAYRQRVEECKQAVAAIQVFDPGVKTLRDVSLEYFVEVQESIPPVPRQRARHVISDSQRVLDLAAAAREGDLREMGRLFVASHRSMQYDYEISCEEIDFLVDTAIKIEGVYGARLTGGGFGGCTVNLVAPEAVAGFREQLAAAYERRYGKTPVFIDCKPAAGAARYAEGVAQ